MTFYLPIAEIEINLLIILFFGFIVGFMSGLFGVGGGFLMTPLLIFMGIPPSTAVGTESVQILRFFCFWSNCSWKKEKY